MAIDLIDRQMAIDALRTCQTYLFDTHDKDKKISREDAEYEIEQLPSAQPKTVCVAKITLSDEQIKEAVEKAKNEVLQAFPSQKRERWEMKPDPYGFFDEIPVCSECGCTTKMRETYKFCPNCGAEMEVSNETD